MNFSAYEPSWLGCWKGVVKIFDFEQGKLIDEGTTNTTLIVDQNIMTVSESYQWSNGRLEQYTLTGKIVNQNCIFDMGRFKGRGCKVDSNTFVLQGATYSNEGKVLFELYGAYFFITHEHRVRNYSYLQNAVIKSVRSASEYKVDS